nr:peptidoglycan editing factor PgeF [Endozoicomonas sp. OPT23]
MIPDWPVPANIKACVTKRAGGVSKGDFGSLNMGLRSGDVPEAVLANREIVRSDWQLPVEPQWLQQVHGTEVVTAQADAIEREGDAVWTDQQNLPCAVLTADCLPVIFCNRAGTKVAAAHAGWKGLQAGVLEQTAFAMSEPADQLIAWMGPAISQKHFEVGPEVRAAFIGDSEKAEEAFVAGEGDRWFGDLYQLARLRLNTLGIDAVYGGGLCTYSDTDSWYSYRRDGKASGRLATLIWMT